ncbi:MAG: hypothetical protein ACU0AT_13195 [Tranquillimonas sp.]
MTDLSQNRNLADMASGRRFLTLRPPERHPLAPVCPRHLRRICGTCTHFTGALHDRQPAPCALGFGCFDPVEAADRCRDWTRRTAPAPAASGDA